MGIRVRLPTCVAKVILTFHSPQVRIFRRQAVICYQQRLTKVFISIHCQNCTIGKRWRFVRSTIHLAGFLSFFVDVADAGGLSSAISELSFHSWVFYSRRLTPQYVILITSQETVFAISSFNFFKYYYGIDPIDSYLLASYALNKLWTSARQR